jgi:small basic protein
MLERLFMARLFLTAGGLLAVISLVLWFSLRIPSMFPPYLATALLALGYGAVCRRRGRPPGAGKS